MARIDLSTADVESAPYPYERRQTYREAHTPNREQQAQRLEVLRYRSYSARSLRQRIMQRLGDVGRDVFPWIAGVRWF